MKKRLSLLLCGALILSMLSAVGCEKKESADDYLGRLITRAKEKDGELDAILEDGISDAKEDNDLVVDFPEELKDSYAEFLQTALNQVQFELNEADEESDDTYVVRVTYEPVDIEATTADINSEFAQTIESADFAAEAEKLLEKDAEAVKKPEKQSKKTMAITVKKSGDSFSISKKSMKKLFKDALQGYMEPYASVAAVFDMRDYVQSILDGFFKGDTTKLQAHENISAEEAASWYQESFSELELDELSDEQNQRLLAALQTMFKNCQYSIGAMQMKSATEYEFQLTTTPNLSLVNANQEVSAGSWATEAESIEGILSIYEKYAAAPAYGTETTITVTWDALDLLQEEDNTDFDTMIDTILPGE